MAEISLCGRSTYWPASLSVEGEHVGVVGWIDLLVDRCLIGCLIHSKI